MNHAPRIFTFALALGLSTVLVAADVKRTPLPADHPLLGAWRIDVPGTQCHEIYLIKANGTTAVTSGAQAAESEFQMDLRPSARGYYKWVDRIVKDNGQPDCMGERMEVGHVATNYIRLHPTKPEFLLCEAEQLDTCVGPFRRQGISI